MSIFDAQTEQVSHLDIPGTVTACAVSPDQKTLYVADPTSKAVEIVDLETKRVKKEVKTGATPGAACSPCRRTASASS